MSACLIHVTEKLLNPWLMYPMCGRYYHHHPQFLPRYPISIPRALSMTADVTNICLAISSSYKIQRARVMIGWCCSLAPNAQTGSSSMGLVPRLWVASWLFLAPSAAPPLPRGPSFSPGGPVRACVIGLLPVYYWASSFIGLHAIPPATVFFAVGFVRNLLTRFPSWEMGLILVALGPERRPISSFLPSFCLSLFLYPSSLSFSRWIPCFNFREISPGIFCIFHFIFLSFSLAPSPLSLSIRSGPWSYLRGRDEIQLFFI